MVEVDLAEEEVDLQEEEADFLEEEVDFQGEEVEQVEEEGFLEAEDEVDSVVVDEMLYLSNTY